MRSIPAGFILLLSLSAVAQTPPPTRPAPLTYAEIVDRAVAAGEQLAAVEKETQALLKSLSGVVGPQADEQRKAVLIKRRTADRQAWIAERRLKFHWLLQGLPEASRAEFADLDPEEEQALLDGRTVQQRLFVPLPPKSFDKVTIEEVLTWIEAKSDVRVVADWPALTKIGVSKIDVVSVAIGRYDKPATETLQALIGALSKDLAVIDPRHTDAVLITTREGQGQLQERDRLLAARVKDARVWTTTPLLQPVAFTQVPLIEVLEKVIGDALAEVHWDQLAALGIKPETPVSVTLGVHRIGHALALVADVLNAIAQKRNAVRFDLLPDGVILLSDEAGIAQSMQAAEWLAAAVAKSPELKAGLARKLPDLRVQNATLADAVQFIRDTSQIDLRVDWVSLAGSGLNEKSTISLDLPSPPVAQIMRLVFRPAPGKPPVAWLAKDAELHVGSTSK